MQSPLKRKTQQTVLNFQPQKKLRPEPEIDTQMDPNTATKVNAPVRPANGQPVKKLVIKNLKGILFYFHMWYGVSLTSARSCTQAPRQL